MKPTIAIKSLLRVIVGINIVGERKKERENRFQKLFKPSISNTYDPNNYIFQVDFYSTFNELLKILKRGL